MLKASFSCVLALSCIGATALANEAQVDKVTASEIAGEVQSIWNGIALSDSAVVPNVAPTPPPHPGPGPHPQPQPNPNPGPHPQPRHDDACMKVRPDDAQKAQLKESLYQYKRSQIALHAELKVAHVDYMHAVMKDGGNQADAQTASASIVRASSKVTEARMSLVNSILFNILRSEQRSDGLRCIMSKMHRRGGHHGGGHGGGHGPQHPAPGPGGGGGTTTPTQPTQPAPLPVPY